MLHAARSEVAVCEERGERVPLDLMQYTVKLEQLMRGAERGAR